MPLDHRLGWRVRPRSPNGPDAEDTGRPLARSEGAARSKHREDSCQRLQHASFGSSAVFSDAYEPWALGESEVGFNWIQMSSADRDLNEVMSGRRALKPSGSPVPVKGSACRRFSSPRDRGGRTSWEYGPCSAGRRLTLRRVATDGTVQKTTDSGRIWSVRKCYNAWIT